MALVGYWAEFEDSEVFIQWDFAQTPYLARKFDSAERLSALCVPASLPSPGRRTSKKQKAKSA